MAAKVLIAEDERNIVESLRFILERAGCVVFHALDGETALDQTRRQRPDVLVLDVMLPKMTGFEVLKRIRGDAALSDLPVLMLTAKGQTQDRRNAEELGASAFVTKPFSNKEIVAEVLRLAAPGA